MGYTVTCPQCSEVNSGSQLYCVKCQTSLIGIPRQEHPTPQPIDPSPASAPDTSQSIPQPRPKKSFSKPWLIAGMIIGLIIFGGIICLVTGAIGFFKINAEKAPIEATLDSFMRHMLARDVESAYALFSPRAQRIVPISELQESLGGNNYILFSGYQDLSVYNVNISKMVSTNSDSPQGTVAKVNGTINYENGIQGTITATLEKVDGKWLLYNVNVSVPPDKFQPSV